MGRKTTVVYEEDESWYEIITGWIGEGFFALIRRLFSGIAYLATIPKVGWVVGVAIIAWVLGQASGLKEVRLLLMIAAAVATFCFLQFTEKGKQINSDWGTKRIIRKIQNGAQKVVEDNDRASWKEYPYVNVVQYKRSYGLEIGVPYGTDPEEIRSWEDEFEDAIGGVTVTANPARKNVDEVTFKIVRNNLKKN